MDTVTRATTSRPFRWTEKTSLYGGDGRKYLNFDERMNVLSVFDGRPMIEKLFGHATHWTGGRVSEVLSILPINCQVDAGIIALRTLKRRNARRAVPTMREIPVPPFFMKELDAFFQIMRRQREGVGLHDRLWPWSRVTAWRIYKSVMAEAGISGARACPRGMRHGFGVGTLQARIPLNQAQIWMGHADIATTAIYAEACGPEQIALAQRYWSFGQQFPAAAPHANVSSY